MKKYYVIPLNNKDYKIVAEYAPNCQVHFNYCYNSMGNTYMGTQIESFIENVRGLLRVSPDFFDVFDGSDYEKSFKRLGFEKVNPTPQEIRLWQSFNL